MIYSCLSCSKKDEDTACCCGNKKDCRDIPTLFLLSIATSIDAMAVGLSFAMIKVKIIQPSILIGLITFVVSMIGYYLGKAVGSRIKIELDIVGGLVLIGIGIKILASHLMA